MYNFWSQNYFFQTMLATSLWWSPSGRCSPGRWAIPSEKLDFPFRWLSLSSCFVSSDSSIGALFKTNVYLFLNVCKSVTTLLKWRFIPSEKLDSLSRWLSLFLCFVSSDSSIGAPFKTNVYMFVNVCKSVTTLLKPKKWNQWRFYPFGKAWLPVSLVLFVLMLCDILLFYWCSV